VLEPDGPDPYPEGWRLSFQHGTLHLLLGNWDAARNLPSEAERYRQTAEGANNPGIAHVKCTQPPLAAEQFRVALDRFPGYRDAGLNSCTDLPCHVTTHPPVRGESNRLPSRVAFSAVYMVDIDRQTASRQRAGGNLQVL